MLLTNEKIEATIDRIRQAVKIHGANRTYVAFSGGKDSRAVLKLARCVLPRPITIHNGHAGESIGTMEGVLCVKEPKATNVPEFLRTVDVKCQIDGTRRDEDDHVVFDGKTIHRSVMPTWRTCKGIWDLEVVFPLWDWTEQEVFEFLDMEETP